MTSSRGQNVSIFQHPGSERWKPAIAPLADTGGSFPLTSGCPRSNATNFGKNASVTEKNSGQHLFKTCSTGSYANSGNKDNSFTSACANAFMANSVNSTSALNSMNRELSPVRWCDRTVDGVYLGRSGWVQVQHRSLDDSKGVVYCDRSSFSTLPCRKHFSDVDPDFAEGREYNRPFHLPLPSKKRTIRENYERPSKFAQEFEAISPPSVTPIISPPPAFKDDGSNVEFPRQPPRKPYCCQESFHPRSEIYACPPKERRNTVQSLPGSASSLKHERLPYRASQTKSLEDDFYNRTYRDTRFNSSEPVSTIGFRDLDNDAGVASNSAIRVSDSDKEEDAEDYCGNEMANTNGYFLSSRNSSREELNGHRISSKAFRQRNYQRNGRRTSSTYRTRSSSSDSSSSGNGNFSSKNAEKAASSRRTSSRDKQQTFEFEISNSRNSKQFHVKRSRSLQLSEKRSPSESVLNYSPSGKSWDSMPPEHSTFQLANQKSESVGQFPQHLHHFLVTVKGDSIPVGNSSIQSLRSLNKITTSEDEQKKLILEAEKEARIISEFLNGSRSRTAARNLLMHRYLNRHEELNLNSTENLSPNAEFDSRFLEIDQRDNLWKNNKSNSSNFILRQQPTTIYSKPFTSFFRASTYSRAGSVMNLPQNAADQGKKEQTENSGGGRSCSPLTEQRSKDCRSKNKGEANRCRDRPCDSAVLEKLPPRLHSGKQKSKNEMFDKNLLKGTFRFSPQLLTGTKLTGREGGDFAESSSPSSSSPSSSPDICRQMDSGTKVMKKIEKVDASSLFEDLMLGGNVPASGSEDSTAAAFYQRSLSLPRSFLSERHRLNYSNHRDLLKWQKHDEESLEESAGGSSQRSRTAPTTPTRDLRFCKKPENLRQIQSTVSSCASHLDESALPSPRRMVRKSTQEEPELFDVNPSERNSFLISENLQQKPENSAETVTQQLKRNFPLKYQKPKGHFNECKEFIRQANLCEVISPECRLMSGFQALESDHLDSQERCARFDKEQIGPKKGLTNEKYDSHDSGIQMGNRGNIDSSESQDTDLQEDIDSPLVVRKREIRDGRKFVRAESEFLGSSSSDQLQVGPLRKTDTPCGGKMKKHASQKAVRRTNSDMGSQKSLSLDVGNLRRSILVSSRPSPPRERHGKTAWGKPSPDKSAIRDRFIGTELRRSLSQPLGLNDLPPSSRPSALKCVALSEDEKNLRGKNSEDECLSDSESSVASLQDRRKFFDSTSTNEAVVLAEAVWDHVAIESCELPFRAGDVIEVLDTQNWDWWWGATAESRGYFPSAFVRLRVNQEDTVEDCLAAMAKGKYASNRLRRGKSVSLLSNDQVRSSVVRELLHTEQDFVKMLRDLRDGYVEQCRHRTDMFTSAQITTIFSNLEDLLNFQEKFLKDLEATVDKEFPYKSRIGKVFLAHGSGFRMYSEYCNSYPMAMATLQDLYQKDSYCEFFETCRLKQSLTEIPLDGYLLTPVQRICKYPLQLAELLKYTKPDHPDCREVEEALETMRAVATLINERKRKMESLEKLAAWQQRVEGWVGEDLIEISSRLIHQGDVVRITSGVWSSRICLDASVVVDVPDGKNQQLGATVKYGLKICSSLKDKWLLFCCRSSEDKAKWLEALAEEKRLVAQDREVGLDLPPTAKILAKMAARTKKCPPYKPRGKNKFMSNHEEISFRNCHSTASKIKSARKVGTWFTFGGVIKNSKTTPRPRASVHRVT